MKPNGMTDEVYARYQKDGFTETDIDRIWEETLMTRGLMAKRVNQVPRYITSSTYENERKRRSKQVNDLFKHR